MPSPFPGMDPYLEDQAIWPQFQQRFVLSLQQVLQATLADSYCVVVKQRQYVAEEPLAPTLARREQREDYLEVRRQHDDRLITQVDVVSLANKLSAAGRKAYLDQRRESMDGKANHVEIDLVRQGPPTLDYSRDGLPEWDYAVTVARSHQPNRYEIYTATLRTRLPRLRLPLAAHERDILADVQNVFTRAYDHGNFASQIDYGHPPSLPLNSEDHGWIANLLVGKQFREFVPAHEDIAQAAYFLWQAEGCPHGRDQELWQRALEQLRERVAP